MTTNSVTLLDSIMLVGTADSTAAVQTLDMLGQSPTFTEWHGHTVATAFALPVHSGMSLAQRIASLLLQLQQQNDAFCQQHLVYLVLPEAADANDAAVNDILPLVMQQMPQLLMTPGCRVFPYGSAGALMALNAAIQYWRQEANPVESLWLVAVDSLAADDAISGINAAQRQTMLVSEGAIALCLSPGGDNCQLLHRSDACTSSAEQDIAIAGAFSALANHLQQPLTQLYLPDSGDEKQRNRWLEQCSCLHGALDSHSELIFPAYATGELGACGGLYRLWLVLSRLQQGRTTGLVAQLEISARRYRALTLFGAADSDSITVKEAVNKDVRKL